MRRAGEFQLLFTLLKVAIILGIVAVGFSYRGGTWANFATEFTGAKGGVAGFFAALVAALWAYDGWNDLTMVAGEIRNPQRNIPLSLIWGVATVGALYILVNAAVQYVLPAAAVAGSERPASDAVALVLGSAGASLVSAGMAVSMLVTLNGTIMSGARVPFATARDGYFFKAIAEVHPRFHTPSVAIVVQCGLAIVLLLLGGNFRQFFSLAIFAEWMFYMIAGSTVFVFRRREPNAERPYRVWGYPVVPALFVLASAALLYYTFTDNLKSSAAGCLAILAGVPVFYFFARRRAEWLRSNRSNPKGGYQRTRASDTFTPCPNSPKVKTPTLSSLPSFGPTFWSDWMPTYDRGFQLGLLPERKWNWRTFAASYGILVCLILLLIVVGIMVPDTLLITANYHVTELIPRPALRPEPLPKPKPLPLHAKLLPPPPVFETPKLIVPREMRAPKPQPQEIEPPKVALNNFAPAVLRQTQRSASGADSYRGLPGKFGGADRECSDREGADRRVRRSEWAETECQQQAERQADRIGGGWVRHAGGTGTRKRVGRRERN